EEWVFRLPLIIFSLVCVPKPWKLRSPSELVFSRRLLVICPECMWFRCAFRNICLDLLLKDAHPIVHSLHLCKGIFPILPDLNGAGVGNVLGQLLPDSSPLHRAVWSH